MKNKLLFSGFLQSFEDTLSAGVAQVMLGSLMGNLVQLGKWVALS